MPGLKSEHFDSHATQKCIIRQDVVTPDPSPLSMPYGEGNFDNRYSRRGDNNKVFLYAVLNGEFSHVRVELWIDADSLDITPTMGPDVDQTCPTEEMASSSSESSQSSSGAAHTGRWCSVDYWNITEQHSEFIQFRDLPPGTYKVTIPEMVGAGSITIKAQWTD